MTDETPLERLDSAIREFFASQILHETGAEVSGWVIAASTSRIQSDHDEYLPIVTGTSYTIGPGTSMAEVIGLGNYVAAVAQSAALDSTGLATGR